MRTQHSLFDADTTTDATPDPRVVANAAVADFAVDVARRKLGVGTDWQWHYRKVMGPDAQLVRGAIPIGTKRDGSPRWPKASEDRECVVTDAEIKAEREAWEARTGLCADCGGCGERRVGWSRETGPIFRPCASPRHAEAPDA